MKNGAGHDERDAFENELLGFRPRGLSPEVMERIESGIMNDLFRENAREPRGAALVRRLAWAAAVLILAGCAVLYVLRKTAPAVPAVATAAQPAEQAPGLAPGEQVVVGSVLVAQNDEGMVLIPNVGPARRIRYRVVDSVEISDERTGRRISAAVPREGICLVSVEAR